MESNRAKMNQALTVLNNRTNGGYTIDHSYGGFKLESNGGSRCVSPRLTARELAEWLRAFLAGMDEQRQLDKENAQ